RTSADFKRALVAARLLFRRQDSARERGERCKRPDRRRARRASTDVTHRRFLRALVGDYGRYVAHVVRDCEYESFRRVDLVESGFPLLDFARDTAHDYDFGCIEVFFERDEQSGV